MNRDPVVRSEASNTASQAIVQPVKFGHSNVYLIRTQTGHILVDAGMPNKERELAQVLDRSEVDPSGILLIIATHAHLDHVGCIAYAQKVSGGKVLCHRNAADYLKNGKPEPAIPQNLLGRFLNILTGLSGASFEAVRPDILVESAYDLAEFGIAGEVIHTPGHSPSSVSIILSTGEALIGDLVRDEGGGRIGLGMFYADERAVVDSLEKVANYKPHTIYLSHGNTIDFKRLKDFLEMPQSGRKSAI